MKRLLPGKLTWREVLKEAGSRSARWRFVVPAAMLLAVTLSLPSFKIGFFNDDYLMFGQIEGWYGFETSAVNLYGAFLELPGLWWKSPDAHISFWRPLSSALIRLSYLLFGHSAALYHLELLLGLAALIAVCGRLYRDLSPAVGSVALLIFAAEEAHAYTSGIVNHGHTLVSVISALLGLAAYLRWRKSGWRPGLWLSLLGFVVGLLGGETAFAVMAYPLAYELFAATEPFARRLRAIGPIALLAVTYLLFYRAMGFGPGQTGVYLNPFEQPPVEFLAGLATYLPLYSSSLLGALPMQLAQIPTLGLPYLLAGVALPVTLFWGWRKIREELTEADRKALLGWGFGALGALLPVTLAPPSERQLIVPAIGLAPLLAAFVVVSWQTWRQPEAGRRTRTGAVSALVLLVLLHLGVASWNRVTTLLSMARDARSLEAMAREVATLTSPAAGHAANHEVLLLGADFRMAVYGPSLFTFQQGTDQISWTTLTMAPLGYRLTRTTPRTIVLEPIDGEILASVPENVFRLPGDEYASGDAVKARLFTVEILAVGEIGLTRIAFDFEHDLDQPGVTFLALADLVLERLDLPAVGDSVLVERPNP